VVGPACVLTHATAGLSFVALQFSESDLIRTFGQAGLISTAIALVAVLVLCPLLGMLLIRDEGKLVDAVRGHDFAIGYLRRFCSWMAVTMVKRPGLYSLIDLAIVVALGIIYLQLQPRYRLADQVPDREHAVLASERLDAKLAGANPVDIYIRFPKGQSLYDPASLGVIADVHAAVEKQAGVGQVWSLDTLRRWLAEKAGRADVATLKEYVDLLPSHLTRRFISAEGDSVIVSGRIPDVDASQLLPVVKQLDGTMATIQARYPGTEVAVTGLATVAARNTALMISRLNVGLTLEIVFVAAFIGLAFGSFVVMLASILPAILPIFLSGAALWVTGQGLQFASVVALIVSFGLGLSATIHFLNRLRLEIGTTGDPRLAVERATILMGPPLILTSLVLACGLVVTVFSDLPSLRLFGWLSAFAMLAALLADLLVLRPTIMWLWTVSGRWKSGKV
jgi:predicted RND superfamily exporter protein